MCVFSPSDARDQHGAARTCYSCSSSVLWERKHKSRSITFQRPKCCLSASDSITGHNTDIHRRIRAELFFFLKEHIDVQKLEWKEYKERQSERIRATFQKSDARNVWSAANYASSWETRPLLAARQCLVLTLFGAHVCLFVISLPRTRYNANRVGICGEQKFLCHLLNPSSFLPAAMLFFVILCFLPKCFPESPK